GRSEMLIAHEREIRRIGDAAFPTATPVLFVTPDAGRDEDGVTTVDVAGIAARRRTVIVGRNAVVRDHTPQLPTIPDSLRQDVDLLIRERTTGAQRERRLCRPRDAGGDHLAYAFGRHHGEIDRIIQRARRPQAPGLAVTPRAIPRIERLERHDLGRRELASVRSWPAGHRVASRQGERRREGCRGEPGHLLSSPRPPRPVASTRARATNGRDCAVATGVARLMTYPVARPKAICDATNHAQSIRAFSAGLMTPSVAQRNPVHSSGPSRPPQRR